MKYCRRCGRPTEGSCGKCIAKIAMRTGPGEPLREPTRRTAVAEIRVQCTHHRCSVAMFTNVCMYGDHDNPPSREELRQTMARIGVRESATMLESTTVPSVCGNVANQVAALLVGTAHQGRITGRVTAIRNGAAVHRLEQDADSGVYYGSSVPQPVAAYAALSRSPTPSDCAVGILLFQPGHQFAFVCYGETIVLFQGWIDSYSFAQWLSDDNGDRIEQVTADYLGKLQLWITQGGTVRHDELFSPTGIQMAGNRMDRPGPHQPFFALIPYESAWINANIREFFDKSQVL